MRSGVVMGPMLIPRTASQGQGHAYGGSAPPQSEQINRKISSDLHSALRDPNILNRREHEDLGLGVRPPPETAPERTYGGGQDAHDLVRSGRPGGKRLCSGCTVARIDCY